MSEIRTNLLKSERGDASPSAPFGLRVSGVCTATTFKGAIDASTGTFSSNVTISGNLGVGGTITYEDVARVDATGISTFREGYKVGPLTGIALTAYKDGSIRTSGIITASSFVGDGSTLTGIASTDNINTSTPATFGSINATGIVTATTFVPSQGQLSHRNLIINGAMTVNQYGGPISAEGYVCDRFNLLYTGTDNAPTLSKHSLSYSGDALPFAAGFRNSLHLQNGNQTGGAGSGDYMILRYKVEAQDLACSGWNFKSASSYITLSYWVKSSVAQNFYAYMRSDDGTAQMYVWETGTLTADTWKKITVKIPGLASGNIDINNDNGIGMMITFPTWWGGNWTNNNALNTWAAYDSANRTPDWTNTWWNTNNATFEITGVQLEVGEVATPFEHRSYGEELSRCQRYYWYATKKGSTSDVTNKGLCMAAYVSSSDIRGTLEFPVEMRAEPTLSSNDNNNSWYMNAGTNVDLFDRLDLYSATQKRAVVRNSAHVGGTAGQGGMIAQETGDSFLTFSAEL